MLDSWFSKAEVGKYRYYRGDSVIARSSWNTNDAAISLVINILFWTIHWHLLSVTTYIFPLMKQPCVYIVTNPNHTVLYTGVTSNLVQRIWQHRNKEVPGFTSRYNITKLVYYEMYGDICLAIEREKQIKAGSRRRKIELIESFNPEWRDLYDSIWDCFVAFAPRNDVPVVIQHCEFVYVETIYSYERCGLWKISSNSVNYKEFAWSERYGNLTIHKYTILTNPHFGLFITRSNCR